MNILENYIRKNYSVEDVTEEMKAHGISTDDERFFRVRMSVDCYGNKSDTEQIFRASEWEKVKKKGYFMG